jgi:hypothetical protein
VHKTQLLIFVDLVRDDVAALERQIAVTIACHPACAHVVVGFAQPKAVHSSENVVHVASATATVTVIASVVESFCVLTTLGFAADRCR